MARKLEGRSEVIAIFAGRGQTSGALDAGATYAKAVFIGITIGNFLQLCM